jgi:hypothetical protein
MLTRQVSTAVQLQAAARGLLARRRLQEMRQKMRGAALAAVDLGIGGHNLALSDGRQQPCQPAAGSMRPPKALQPRPTRSSHPQRSAPPRRALAGSLTQSNGVRGLVWAGGLGQMRWSRYMGCRALVFQDISPFAACGMGSRWLYTCRSGVWMVSTLCLGVKNKKSESISG